MDIPVEVAVKRLRRLIGFSSNPNDYMCLDELERLARIGAAVEAMPKGVSLYNRGTAVHQMGDAWDVDDVTTSDGEWLGTGLDPLEALQKAADTARWKQLDWRNAKDKNDNS